MDSVKMGSTSTARSQPQWQQHLGHGQIESPSLLSHHDDQPLRSSTDSDSDRDGISRHATLAAPRQPSTDYDHHNGSQHSAASSPSLSASLPSSTASSDAFTTSTRSTQRTTTSTTVAGLDDRTYHEEQEEEEPPSSSGGAGGIRPSDREKNCDRMRPEEAGHPRLPTIMSNQLIGQTVSPYLREHIPGLYAPVAKHEASKQSSALTLSAAPTRRDPNSKYCYRHDPNTNCRRAADETKMVMIQNSLDKLPTADQQAITHVWSLFSAAPSKHRELMLQGIMTQCCFPQLSIVSREVHEQLKIDFLTAFPKEVSFNILCYLDTVSLCKAAQVSVKWRELADSDAVWSRMCEQHIDRKCTKCGWGLPLLERKRLRDWTRQRQLAKDHSKKIAAAAANSLTAPVIPAPMSLRAPSPPMTKRDHASSTSSGEDEGQAKRRCTERVGSINSVSSASAPEPSSTALVERKVRPFKDVYRDRFKIGYNWRHGKCGIKILKGHSNGVTCLQLLDNFLATGSYDATIKIWNIETGEEIRTLRGHSNGVRALQFDEGGKLISGSLDGTTGIWNWHTGELINRLRAHAKGVITVHFEGELLASGSIDHTIKVFNFETKKTFCLKGHTDWVNSVKVDPESRTLVSASDDFKVKLWDLDTKTCIRTFDGHTGHVQQVLPLPPDFEPDEELLRAARAAAQLELNGSSDASAPSSQGRRPSNSSSGSSGVLRHPDHAELTRAGQQAEDQALRASYGDAFADEPSRPLPSRYMLSGGLDSTVRLIDSATGRCLKPFFGHFEGVWGLAGDTLRAVTGANDGMVKVWEPTSGKCERTFTGHRGPVTCVSLSDSRMASGGEDGEVRLYCFQDSDGLTVGTPS